MQHVTKIGQQDLFDDNDEEIGELERPLLIKRQNWAVKCTKTARNKTNKVQQMQDSSLWEVHPTTKKERITCKLCGI